MLINKTRVFGGTGGVPFEETGDGIVAIQRVVVHYSDYVHQLEVTYLLDDGQRLHRAFGGPGGTESREILLADDEKIFAVIVRSGAYVDSLTFVTYRMFNLIGMKRYGPFGGSGGQQSTVLSPEIQTFFGRAGGLLDAIGFRGEEPILVC